ncbi:MAG: family 78 glycoside hydrolase catalytic domain [Oscillospiraceae bacterium]|nr:family 78 glycoside hydrolase catalytic domain [Oscillospiraceae bacterium]
MTQYEMFKNALWVQASHDCVSPTFRGTFRTRKGETAQITVCGLGFFALYINGEPVTEDRFVPANSHYHPYADCFCAREFGEEMACRIYCMQYDLTPYLADGENVLTAEVGPGWYFRYGSCKLCYRIRFADRDVVSDLSLRWREGPLDEFALTHGEKFDYTKYNYNDGFMMPDYDAGGWKCVSQAETPDSRFFVQDCPADRVIRTIVPQKIAESADTVFYDLGENVTGWPVVHCAQRREITVAAGEVFDPETVSLPEKWAHRQVTSYKCDGTEREYHPQFTWTAGRYYAVSRGAEFVRFEVIHADTPHRSAFSCSDETLNWLYDAYIRTQLCNMHAGIPSDCPHLERRGYTGDGQLTCETAMLTLSCREFYRKWMRDISDCQDRKSGHVQYTAPYVQSGGGPGGWGCAIVEVPYVYYRTYGDPEPLYLYFPQMLRYFDYLNAHSEKDLVVSDQPGQWCLGEWCTPGKKTLDLDIPNPFVNNYFFVKSLDRAMEIARVIGEQSHIPALQAMRQRKADALVQNYFDPETGDFAGDRHGANAFAADIGLGDERTVRRLAEHVDDLQGVNVGIFGIDIVPRVLFERGYAAQALRMLTFQKQPSFGYMKACGATTLWEEWDDPRSMSHPMYGAPIRYLFYYILGIRQTADACGYKKIVIDPADLPQISFARGQIETANGVIAVEIDRKNGTLTVQIPQGVEAAYKNKPLCAGENRIKL